MKEPFVDVHNIPANPNKICRSDPKLSPIFALQLVQRVFILRPAACGMSGFRCMQISFLLLMTIP